MTGSRVIALQDHHARRRIRPQATRIFSVDVIAWSDGAVDLRTELLNPTEAMQLAELLDLAAPMIRRTHGN